MKNIVFIILLLLSPFFIFAQSNPILWANKAGGTNYEYCNSNSIAVDTNGNSYVTGYFNGSATFGIITLTSNGSYDIFVAKLDSNGNWLWAKQAGGINYDCGNSIAVDASGNIYVTGRFRNTAIFDTTTVTGSNSNDIFVAKLDSNGNWLWAKQAGGADNDCGYGIAVDASGNIYVSGWFQGVATFGYTNITSTVNSADIFVAKMDSNGNWLWVNKAGGTTTDNGNSIAVDSSGNIYVTGWFQGVATFGTTNIKITSNGDFDIFIAKLDSNGNWLWAKQAGGTKVDYGNSIAVDTNGNSYVTGSFASLYATFGTTTLSNYNTNNSDDIFVAKLDKDGNWCWAKKAGGGNFEYGYGIAVDANGNSYVTGYFATNGATFGTITLINSGGRDIFVAKLDSNGNWLWAKQAGGGSSEFGYGIAVDASGNSYVIGYFSGTTTLGSTTLTSSGGYDILVAKVHIPYYPNNIPVVEETYGIRVTVTGGDADRGRVDNFPLIPNHSATYKKFNFILDNSIATWTIKMQTNHTYGAYYQNNQWNVVNGDGTQVIFNINFSGTKEEVEIPIILGNENPALPVELSSFTAYISPQNKINIMWTTQTETGLQGYYIMRSNQNDLSTATLISTLITATNTSEPRSYLYTDEEVTKSGTYYYWLQCNDLDGTINIYGSVSIDYNPGGNTTPSILVTELQPVYPNPFNPIAYIPYTLESRSEVKINIYNTRGQVVKTFELGTQDKGYHRITWDGRDNDGSLCGNGIYYLVMKAGNSSFQQKAVLMK